MPLARALLKASSRSGPVVPLVPARASEWQLPQVPLPMKSVLPFTRSGCELCPQPATTGAATAAAIGMTMRIRDRGRGKAAGILDDRVRDPAGRRDRLGGRGIDHSGIGAT